MAKEVDFWERVARALKSKNWTQADLVRASGLPPPTVTHWKTGTEPRASQLAKAASALGVSMDQLWGVKPLPDLEHDAGRLSKPESDMVVLYRENERFRRIVRNLIEELGLKVED